MDNLKRLSVVALAAAVGVVSAQEKASAGIIVDTMDGTTFSPRDVASSNPPTGEQTALVQGFSITDTSVLNSAALRGFSLGADITIAIAATVGPGATSSDVLFEQVFAMTADEMGTSIRTFSLGGVSLGPGDYFFVVMSDDPAGFEWAKVSPAGSVNINDRGSATYPAVANWYEQSYAFITGATGQVFTLEIDGTPIPTPAGGVLMIGAGAGLLARRRRR